MIVRALLGEISCNKSQYILLCWHAMALLVEALRYRPEGRGFDSGRTIFQGSTHFVKKMNTRESCGDKGGDA